MYAKKMYAKWIEVDQRFSFSDKDNGGVEITEAAHLALRAENAAGKLLAPGADGVPVALDPGELTVDQIIAEYVAAIQVRLDKFAQTRGYDGIASLVSYAGDPDPVLDAEGSYGKQARSATWVTSRTIYAEVKAGTRQAPTLAELFAELPVLIWPV